ncbi:hypothetical protein N836_19715 [Leptolyngbya sp. Heron Island J]|uniref:hypothetical protein n=1 Tax=Leptolyngbya sp. Heron Island J TaxID=1385935 RepID=UPI0003B9C8C4|nr:hypothetical protein [Leptolyngbya sp. Heron Island J]ESA33865.1 hypothetical protein N836_19715 [Leptolyngbya sp. Heron Island J]
MATEQMTIYVPPQVKKAIKQFASHKEQSMNTVVVEALQLAIATWTSQNAL